MEFGTRQIHLKTYALTERWVKSLTWIVILTPKTRFLHIFITLQRLGGGGDFFRDVVGGGI